MQQVVCMQLEGESAQYDRCRHKEFLMMAIYKAKVSIVCSAVQKEH